VISGGKQSFSGIFTYPALTLNNISYLMCCCLAFKRAVLALRRSAEKVACPDDIRRKSAGPHRRINGNPKNGECTGRLLKKLGQAPVVRSTVVRSRVLRLEVRNVSRPKSLRDGKGCPLPAHLELLRPARRSSSSLRLSSSSRCNSSSCRLQRSRPLWSRDRSVSMPCRVVLGTDDQTAAFLCATVDRFDDVDQLLLVL
jgi:hypothetical protein